MSTASKTVIKLNNIPHGFYETQMEKYFSQFGKVKNVLVVRSKRTHKSRGFGFVEFELAQVAKIAADAMHNYLMFDNVLKCRQMDRKDLPKKLFKTSYKGATSVQKEKKLQTVDQRDTKNLREHYKKIMRTQRLLGKLGIHIEPLIINHEHILDSQSGKQSGN